MIHRRTKRITRGRKVSRPKKVIKVAPVEPTVKESTIPDEPNLPTIEEKSIKIPKESIVSTTVTAESTIEEPIEDKQMKPADPNISPYSKSKKKHKKKFKIKKKKTKSEEEDLPNLPEPLDDLPKPLDKDIDKWPKNES